MPNIGIERLRIMAASKSERKYPVCAAIVRIVVSPAAARPKARAIRLRRQTAWSIRRAVRKRYTPTDTESASHPAICTAKTIRT